MKKISVLTLSAALCCASSFAQQTDSLHVGNSDSSVTNREPCAFVTVTKSGIPFNRIVSGSSALRAIDGNVAGVQSTNGSGQPGTSPELLIRGMGSFYNNNGPLIVLDGAAFFGNVSSLNSQDIESITVLKDAAATLPYGSRGGNGVIEIKTKKGGTTGPKLNVDARFGTVTRGIRDYDIIKSEKDYYELAYSGLNGYPMLPVFNQYIGYNAYDMPFDQLFTADGRINPNASLRYHDDWSKELQRTGLKHDYNVSYSGAGKKGSYYLGTGYLNEQGYLKGTSFERFSLSFNGDIKLTQWLKAGINSTVSTNKQRFTLPDYRNPIYVMRFMAPIYPVYIYDASGQQVTDPATGKPLYDYGDPADYPESSMGIRPFTYGTNLAAAVDTQDLYTKSINGSFNPYIEATFLKQITLSAQLHYDLIRNDDVNENMQPGVNSAIMNAKTDGKFFTINQMAIWKPDFENHHIKLLAAHENYKQRFDYHYEFTHPGGVTGSSGNEMYIDKLEAFYATADYNFRSKYFLSAGFRTDISTAVSTSDSRNNYWAIKAAYDISKENFLKNAEWLNELKLSVSYGKQGTHSLPANPYPYQSIDYRQAESDKEFQIQPNVFKQWTAGLNLTMFNNRLSITLDVYDRLNNNLWTRRPTQTFLVSYLMNVRNRGLELTLNADVMRSENITWNTRFMLTHNSNKIVSFEEDTPFAHLNFTKLQEGNSLYDFYLPEYAGVDPVNGDALYYITNDQGQRVTTNDIQMIRYEDRINAGSAFPKFYGSFRNTLSWKQFDFMFQLNFSVGGKYYDNAYAQLMSHSLDGTNYHQDMLNHWTPTNTNTDVPRYDIFNQTSYILSNRFLTDASYLNIKTIYLGYNFSEATAKSMKLKALSIYLTADNVWLFSARKGMDPQATFNNIVGSTYVPSRTVMMGVHVGL